MRLVGGVGFPSPGSQVRQWSHALVLRCLVPKGNADLIPFQSRGLRSWWQFSFWLWTERTCVWFMIKRKTVTVVVFFSVWKELEKISRSVSFPVLTKNSGNRKRRCRVRDAEHAEKYSPDLIKSNPNQILFTMHRLIWKSKRTYLVHTEKTFPKQSKRLI